MDATLTETVLPIINTSMTDVPLNNSPSDIEVIEDHSLATGAGAAAAVASSSTTTTTQTGESIQQQDSTISHPDYDGNKSKRNSLKRFFQRKSRSDHVHNVSHDDVELASNTKYGDNSCDTSSNKSNSLGRRLMRLGRSSESNKKKDTIDCTESGESSKSLKSALSNYWNSLFKKSKESHEGDIIDGDDEMRIGERFETPGLNGGDIIVENQTNEKSLNQNIPHAQDQISVAQSY